MTITQRRQMAKGKAFNAIMRIYHPKAKFHYNNYDECGSYAEQRDYEASSIIEKYLKELAEINA
jgi:hypothetical protein